MSEQPTQKNYLVEQPLAKLQFIDPNTEKSIVYNARVSNPSSQAQGLNDGKLIAYCIKNGHWSILEQANARFEITTSRAISAQILRPKICSSPISPANTGKTTRQPKPPKLN